MTVQAVTDLYPDNEPVDVAEFLAAIWGNGLHSLCWDGDDDYFPSEFFEDSTRLLARAGELMGQHDVWFGAHPLKARPEGGRGTATDVAEVVALPTDLDWAHETRRTKEPLPTEAELRKRLRLLGPELQPSIIVNSGHGLQAWWLLFEPVAPELGQHLLDRLGVALENVGLENGRKDLASILRLPGTFNRKGVPVPVVIEPVGTNLERWFGRQNLDKCLPKAVARPLSGGTKHRPGAVTDEQKALRDFVVTRHEAHSVNVRRNGSIHVMRPGKEAKKGSPSASIITGKQGDAILTVFSDNWTGLEEGSYVLGIDGELHHPRDDELTQIVGNAGPSPTKAREDSGGGAVTKKLGLFRRYTMAELDTEPDDFEWLVRGMLAQPTYGQIAGEMKTLKSYFAGFTAVGVAAGIPIFGQFKPDRAGPVSAYVGEGGRILWKRRMRRICSAMGVTPGDLELHPTFDVAPIPSPVFQESLRRDLDELEPALVTLDPLYTYHGTTTKASDLHQEGALLNMLSTPCVDAGSSLLAVNHMNQTGSGMSLKRITMAGSGEWADTWMLLAHRERPDVEKGVFRLTLEIGSRQWGGSIWDLDLDIGRFDIDTGAHDGAITWDLNRATAASSQKQDTSKDRARLSILEILYDMPWELNKSQLMRTVGGNNASFRAAHGGLVEEGRIRHNDGNPPRWGLAEPTVSAGRTLTTSF